MNQMSLSRLKDLAADARAEQQSSRVEKGRIKVEKLLITNKSAIIKAAKKGKNSYDLRWYFTEDKDIKAFIWNKNLDGMWFELADEELLGYTLIAKW
jgi:hypothetical protein